MSPSPEERARAVLDELCMNRKQWKLEWEEKVIASAIRDAENEALERCLETLLTVVRRLGPGAFVEDFHGAVAALKTEGPALQAGETG